MDTRTHTDTPISGFHLKGEQRSERHVFIRKVSFDVLCQGHLTIDSQTHSSVTLQLCDLSKDNFPFCPGCLSQKDVRSWAWNLKMLITVRDRICILEKSGHSSLQFVLEGKDWQSLLLTQSPSPSRYNRILFSDSLFPHHAIRDGFLSSSFALRDLS